MPIVIEQPTAEAVLEAAKTLPAEERKRLVSLIIHTLTPASVVDDSTEWSDEDLRDFSKASWNLINRRLEEEENA